MTSTYAHDGNRTGLIVYCISSIAGSSYSYDDMDRLSNVNVGAGSSRVSASYSFTPAGYLTNQLYRNGVSAQYACDAVGRLTGLIHAKAGLHFVQHCGLARHWPIVLTKDSASGIIEALPGQNRMILSRRHGGTE